MITKEALPIKILVVEDESIIALDIKLRLEELGYQIVGIVPSGELALKTIEDNDVDLIVMDISLNGKLDGVETAELIRNNYSNIFVIYVTANNLSKNEKIKLTEPYECISKPLEESELENVIENYVLEACG